MVCRSVVYGRRQHLYIFFSLREISKKKKFLLFLSMVILKNPSLSHTQKFRFDKIFQTICEIFKMATQAKPNFCPWSQRSFGSLHSMLDPLNQSVNNLCHPLFCQEPIEICKAALGHPILKIVHVDLIKLSFGPWTTGFYCPTGGD